MFLWIPDPEDLAIFFFIPAVWGIADGIWQTQLHGKGLGGYNVLLESLMFVHVRRLGNKENLC